VAGGGRGSAPSVAEGVAAYGGCVRAVSGLVVGASLFTVIIDVETLSPPFKHYFDCERRLLVCLRVVGP
jgi:hypothetical protein